VMPSMSKDASSLGGFEMPPIGLEEFVEPLRCMLRKR
jgi:hypothetical protein